MERNMGGTLYQQTPAACYCLTDAEAVTIQRCTKISGEYAEPNSS
jgi:hypothetical protein